MLLVGEMALSQSSFTVVVVVAVVVAIVVVVAAIVVVVVFTRRSHRRLVKTIEHLYDFFPNDYELILIIALLWCHQLFDTGDGIRKGDLPRRIY